MVTACVEIMHLSDLQKWLCLAYLSADTSLNLDRTQDTKTVDSVTQDRTLPSRFLLSKRHRATQYTRISVCTHKIV